MTKPKFLFITSFLIFSTSLLAQNDFREIGLSIRDEFNLAFVYKKQVEENKYTSYNLLLANLGITSISGNTAASFSTAFSVTFERRKSIADKVQFIHGWTPSLAVGVNRVDGNSGNTTISVISPGLGYRLGFLYLFSEQFYASLQGQISSSVSWQLSDDIDGTPTTFNLGFSQQDISVNFVYRFKKKS